MKTRRWVTRPTPTEPNLTEQLEQMKLGEERGEQPEPGEQPVAEEEAEEVNEPAYPRMKVCSCDRACECPYRMGPYTVRHFEDAPSGETLLGMTHMGDGKHEFRYTHNGRVFRCTGAGVYHKVTNGWKMMLPRAHALVHIPSMPAPSDFVVAQHPTLAQHMIMTCPQTLQTVLVHDANSHYDIVHIPREGRKFAQFNGGTILWPMNEEDMFMGDPLMFSGTQGMYMRMSCGEDNEAFKNRMYNFLAGM